MFYYYPIIIISMMGCGAAEATGLGFVCFVVINPPVLSANIVDLGFFCFIEFPLFDRAVVRVSSKAGSGLFLFLCFCHLVFV